MLLSVGNANAFQRFVFWGQVCMNRSLLGLFAITTAVFWQGPAEAQSARPRSPGEIAAASQVLVVKNEACRRQAREQRLGFFKRRLFMHRCLHPRS
jgi:hypothetical protein